MLPQSAQIILKNCIAKIIESKSPHNLELEVRYKNVDLCQFNKITTFFRKTELRRTSIETTELLYPDSIRCINGGEETPLLYVSKTPLFSPILIESMNLRITFSEEIILNKVKANLGTPITRIKNRSSFFMDWIRIDCTKVKENDITKYEIEIEVYIEKDKKPTAKSASKILQSLLFTIEKVSDLFPKCNRHIQRAMQDVSLLVGATFPGALPDTLTHNNASLLCTHYDDYTITLKANGYRVLLYVDQNGKLYKISRSMSIEVVNDNHLENALQSFTNSLLDAEELNNQYILFDVVFWKGTDMRKERSRGLYDRLNLLTQIQLPQNHSLSIKTFIQLKDFDSKHDWLKTQWGDKYDGLIFTRKSSAYPSISRCKEILKWKPSSHLSVDFLLKKANIPSGTGNTNVSLMVNHGDSGGVNIFSPLPSIILNEMESAKYLCGHVIECNWNESIQSFRPTKIRTEKELPNFIGTAMDVWNAIQNPLPLKMLRFLLMNREYFPFKNLRDKHNSIKRVLINNAIKSIRSNENTKGIHLKVTDLACGRGGDVAKWFKEAEEEGVRTLSFFGIDISNDFLLEARRRCSQLVNPFGMEFNYDFINHDLRRPLAHMSHKEMDIISCQFALHFFFESDSIFSNFINNLNALSREGTIFICTLMDGNKVVENIGKHNNAPDMDNAYYSGFKIELTNDTVNGIIPCSFAQSIYFNMEGHSISRLTNKNNNLIVSADQKEYVVFADDLIFRMRTAGWELISSSPFTCDAKENRIETILTKMNREFMFVKNNATKSEITPPVTAPLIEWIRWCSGNYFPTTAFDDGFNLDENVSECPEYLQKLSSTFRVAIENHTDDITYIPLDIRRTTLPLVHVYFDKTQKQFIPLIDSNLPKRYLPDATEYELTGL